MNGERVNNKIICLAAVCLMSVVLTFSFKYFKPLELLNRNIIINKEVTSPTAINTVSALSPADISTTTSSVRMLFFGDMMLDRDVRILIDRNGFDNFFAGVKDLVKNADISVANLEGTFTQFPSITTNINNKELKFTFDPNLAVTLSDFGFDVLGLANNHTLNFGPEGLESTRSYISSSSMLYYGDPNNKDEISTVITKNNIRIGLIGYHEFSYINLDKIFNEIDRLRPDVDVLIVTPHWGVEYSKDPTEKQIILAHQFIDKGADAVIGSHPHVVGKIEDYKNKKIFYSLGNFVFDQYFSKETMEGLGVVIDVKKKNSKENSIASNTSTGITGTPINIIFDLQYSQVPIEVDKKGVRVANQY